MDSFWMCHKEGLTGLADALDVGSEKEEPRISQSFYLEPKRGSLC